MEKQRKVLDPRHFQVKETKVIDDVEVRLYSPTGYKFHFEGKQYVDQAGGEEEAKKLLLELKQNIPHDTGQSS